MNTGDGLGVVGDGFGVIGVGFGVIGVGLGVGGGLKHVFFILVNFKFNTTKLWKQ